MAPVWQVNKTAVCESVAAWVRANGNILWPDCIKQRAKEKCPGAGGMAGGSLGDSLDRQRTIHSLNKDIEVPLSNSTVTQGEGWK